MTALSQAGNRASAHSLAHCKTYKDNKNKKTKLSRPLKTFGAQIWRQRCFSFILWRSNSTTYSLQTTKRKTCHDRQPTNTRLHHWKPRWKQPLFRKLSNSKLKKKKQMTRDFARPRISFETLEVQDHKHFLSSLEMPNISPGCPDMIKCRASIQALSLKKLPFQLRQESCLHFSPSSSLQVTDMSCWVSLEDFLCETPLSPSFFSYWSKIPSDSDWRSPRVRGAHERDKMKQLPPLLALLPPESFRFLALLDPSKVLPLQLCRCDGDSFLLRVCEQQCPLSLSPPPASSPSCSLPVQLYSHFLLSLLWLVGFSRSLSCYFHTVVLRL